MHKTASGSVSILSVGGLQRAIFLKPLAILLALLMLPPELPLIGRFSLTSNAKAQITVCPPGQSAIYQGCPGDARAVAFEAEAVTDFEKFYNLTPGDGQLIYKYGRADLRMDFRAFMFNKLLNAINDPSNQTVAEKNMIAFFQGVAQAHEIALYQAAVNDRDLFLNHYCQWKPDFDIEGAYDAYMSTLAYCGPTVTALPPIFGGSPDLPTKDYFTTLGYKKAYINALAVVWPEPSAPELQLSTAQIAAIASIAAGGATAGGTATGLIVKFRQKIFPNSVKSIKRNLDVLKSQRDKLIEAGEDTTEIDKEIANLGGDFEKVGLTASRVLGPIGIALVLATIVIGAILAAQAAQERQDTLNGLNSDLSNAQSKAPDLSSWANSDDGLEKIRSIFLELMGPEYPSSTTLPTPAATDPQFVTNSASLTNHVGTISFVDNYGTTWTAQPFGRNWFVQTGVDNHSNAVTKFSNALTYINSVNGVRTAYKAWMNEGFFFIAKLQPGDNDQICTPDSTGLYTGSTTNCHSYSSNALQMLDSSNNPVTITLTQNVGFDGTAYAAFTAGVGGSVTVQAHGIPAPDFTVNDTFPPGVTFSNSIATPGMRSVQINISPSMGPQSFTFHLLFSNAASSISVPFKIDIDTVIHITSPDTLAMTYGQPVNFTVTATGTPVAFSMPSALLPQGVTAIDNGNGTMTISGTPILDVGQSTLLLCIDPVHGSCGISATNAVSQDFQVFHTSIAIPPISITSPNNITFYGGQPNSFQITMSGAQVSPGHSIATVVDTCASSKPAWLTETTLPSGDMVLSGTPPFDGGLISYNTQMVAYVNNGVAGLIPNCGTNAPNFTLNAVTSALFPSSNYVVAVPGVPVPTTVFETLNPIDIFSIDGAVPTGVIEQHSLNSFNFAGTVPVGTYSGDYPLTVTATVGSISGSEKFHFIVGQAPHDDGFKVFNLVINQPGKVVINPAGFPKKAIDSVPAMTATLGSLVVPPGMSINPGTEAGSLEVIGTPTQLFHQTAVFIASNGVAPDLIEGITIRVINPGDINADGHVDCSDVSMVKSALNTRLGFAGYNNLADVNGDGVVNSQDLLLVAKNLPAGTKCQ